MQDWQSESDLGAISKLDAIQTRLVSLDGVSASRSSGATMSIKVIAVVWSSYLPWRDWRMMWDLLAENLSSVSKERLICFTENWVKSMDFVFVKRGADFFLLLSRLFRRNVRFSCCRSEMDTRKNERDHELESFNGIVCTSSGGQEGRSERPTHAHLLEERTCFEEIDRKRQCWQITTVKDAITHFLNDCPYNTAFCSNKVSFNK